MKSNDELNKRRGKRLSECRKDLHLSQELLAEKTGYSIQTISYIENGKRGMSTDAARLFAKHLNVRMEYLLCEDNYKNTLELYNSSVESDRQISNIEQAIVEIGYLPVAVEGNAIASIFDPVMEYECDIMAIEKYIVATPDNRLFTCSEKKYKDLVEDIYDFIKMKMKRFASRSAPATTEEKRLFVGQFHSEAKIQEMVELFKEEGDSEEFIKNYILSETVEMENFYKEFGLTTD